MDRLATASIPDSLAKLKEQGNELFRGGSFHEAAKLYRQAQELSSEDPVYTSNLSAALYELGDYPGAFDAICLAVTKSNAESPDFLQRLSTRMAKCLLYGTVDHTLVSKRASIVEKLESSYHSKEWKMVRAVEYEADRNAAGRVAARSRLLDLNKLKSNLNPTPEFFKIGHDSPMSIIDNWGASYTQDVPLSLNQLSPSKISQLSFLFAGVGDARHVFGSLIGLGRAFAEIGKNKRKKFRAHLTLLDIHPSVLARDLCFLILLDNLVSGKYDEKEQVEIKATLFYSYIGIVMPDYCYQRFQMTVAQLIENLQRDQPRLPVWLHVNASSIPRIVNSLRHWSSDLSLKTSRGMLAVHRVPTPCKDIMADPTIPDEFKDNLFESTALRHINYIKEIMPDDEVIELFHSDDLGECPPPNPLFSELRSAWLDVGRKQLAYDAYLAFRKWDVGVTLRAHREEAWYAHTHVFLPPAVLRKDHHSRYEQLWNAVRTNALASAIDARILREVKYDIDRTWKPNLSLFDHDWDTSNGFEYPVTNINPFSTIKCLEEYVTSYHILQDEALVDRQSPSFSIMKLFFDSVVKSLRDLRGRVQLEVLLGDVCSELERSTSRPTDFPSQFTRLWLSNIPDYIQGPLGAIIYVLSKADPTQDAAVGFNCLYRSGLWPSGDSYCFNYTSLRIEELPRFLGCRVITMIPTSHITLVPQTLPRPLHELASKAELVVWLTMVFIYTILPGYSSHIPSARVINSGNLVMFVDLLVHLHRVGFPPHWLGDFLGAVLSNSLVTDVATYSGEWPVPLEEQDKRVPQRKVNIYPWLVDLESILADAYEAIPFHFVRPADFSRWSSDIGLFQLDIPANPIMAQDKLTGVFLVFYSRTFTKCTHHDLTSEMHDIFEGRRSVDHDKKFYVLTATETVDVYHEVIRWRMSKARMAKLRKEKWQVAVYRSDFRSMLVGPYVVDKSFDVVDK
ncbi:uncharacterized protein EV420DRAFT_1752253 [Desarmillaria tabescens]|uniref:DUF4470 domain-containing protein n=1 Tax=Armillaria tabescens TaxID=1929756 RepID=A0AA39MQB5_ARMTA|nr:uncharacterized protein EV420DRAFT_1752253 [Desarmillaria tabescens]KAK0442712.1 hypothetical protein EV420DRAFT_1752253 [Desarmillaria tabescens]